MALMDRLALCARWPAKSSVESWLAGSRPFSRRYSAHCVNCGQYWRTKSQLPSFAAHGVGKDQQVAALFHRHLVVFGLLAAAVDLPVGQRIGAQIVRRKGQLPARQRGVLHHRLELRLKQLRD